MKKLLTTLTLLAVIPLTGCSSWSGWAVGDSGPDAVTNSHTNMQAVSNSIPNDANVAYLGDVYETGTLSEFQNNFEDAWLQHRDHMFPTPGDHDWPNHATGYDVWFGSRAQHTSGGDWYKAGGDAGWEVFSVNTNVSLAPGSPQLNWLQFSLNSKSGNCAVVFGSFGRWGIAHTDNPNLQPLFDVMQGHAVLYVSADDHLQAEYNPVQGITQLTSGAGGRSLYGLNTDPHPNLAWYQNTQYGALKGDFTVGQVDWQFKNTAGTTLRSGSRTCTPRG